jgi:hypothetical protein
MQFVHHFKLLALAVVTSFSTQADEFQLTPFTSFTAYGNHATEVTLPDEGFTAEKVLLEVELGCAQIGCSLLKLPFTLDYPLGQCLEPEWQSGQPYAKSGELVSFKGVVYKARHWSYDLEPDKSGPWDAWAAVSYCDGRVL